MDDIVDTANTLCKAATALKEHGAKKVVAYCTHPVLSGGAVQRIATSELDEIVVSDTIPLTEEAQLVSPHPGAVVRAAARRDDDRACRTRSPVSSLFIGIAARPDAGKELYFKAFPGPSGMSPTADDRPDRLATAVLMPEGRRHQEPHHAISNSPHFPAPPKAGAPAAACAAPARRRASSTAARARRSRSSSTTTRSSTRCATRRSTRRSSA